MNAFLVWLGSLLIRFLAWSLRLTIVDRGGIVGDPDHAPVIIAFWHNRVLLMAPYYEKYCRGRLALTFISRSRDGQFITDIADRFGVKAVRGSSSKHGMAAALAAIRASGDVRTDIVITPDGPRGPRYQIQPGLVRLAQATQRPIVPISYHLGWKWEMKSWDRFQVPIPFSTCKLITGAPIMVPVEATDAELEEITQRIARGLHGE